MGGMYPERDMEARTYRHVLPATPRLRLSSTSPLILYTHPHYLHILFYSLYIPLHSPKISSVQPQHPSILVNSVNRRLTVTTRRPNKPHTNVGLSHVMKYMEEGE